MAKAGHASKRSGGRTATSARPARRGWGRHALPPLVGLLDEALEGTDVDGLVGTDDPLQPELWASWLVGTWRTRVPLLAPILRELDIDPDRDIGGPLVAADILGPALEATDAWPGAPVPEDVWRLRALLGARLRALPCPAPAAGG